ncbi:hypothetical protein LN565_16165 [Xanthomonas euvesicatoria pv. euvesicatoria]|uniref:Uncharacterized protein n=2 Tax=Xanthomonas TaxID=338 RepID=A0A9Q9IVW0_9XANT|nr:MULTISPECIES: hypothetical protein [Xanthomonas]MBV6690176.1 hypothetical protein [Xanthomonas euvesicatoria pv. physalidis]MBV6787549.1 hypothetical protein [Xanthomonas campestris pv. uppalii]MBV6797287.1 hypothetical protein [Xanthomonas campestris pv. obscurae]MCC8504107.1 hypothetical protein [Xanthomonas euvesicatoria pv. euvesicatoria]MCC8517441.1 hypothetical protein [Xanthomonas euvesicatoria pv. euvesicatoria]
MNYESGEIILLGDFVSLGSDLRGTVVAIIDQADYARGYSECDWSYLGKGVLVLTEDAGLIHEQSNLNLSLIRRGRIVDL